MFTCTTGHASKLGERRILVPVRVREVQTTHNYVDKNTGRRIAIIGLGFETVKEEPYCLEHLPNIKPVVADRVLKVHNTKIRLERDNEDEDDED